MRRIFGAFDKADLAAPYFKSMGKVTDAWFYILQYKRDGVWEKVTLPENATLYKLDKKYAGNSGKLNDLYGVFSGLSLGLDEWYIFTDMHDVVFQTDIPSLEGDANIFVVSEQKTFGEIDFWKHMLPSEMHGWTAYNCGVFAMREKQFRRYLEISHAEYSRMIDWKKNFSATRLGSEFPFSSPYATEMIKEQMGSLYNGIADTYLFNKCIHDSRAVFDWNDVCCYNFAIEQNVAVVKRKKMYNKKGDLFAIAHYNGNAKEKT
jgi:hypothetical protein